MAKLRKSLVAIVIVLCGCSTVDGVTGFKHWHHPVTGQETLSSDIAYCKDRGKRVIPGETQGFMLPITLPDGKTYYRYSTSESTQMDKEGHFTIWDFTKNCLVEMGYQKNETKKEEKLWMYEEIKSKQTDELCWGYGAEGGINYKNELIKTELMTRKKQECLDSFWVMEKKSRMDKELKKIISDLNETEKK